MTERSPHKTALERRLTRRALIAGGMGAVATSSLNRLVDGVQLGEYPLEVHPFSVSRAAKDSELFLWDASDWPEAGIVTLTPECKLIYEPSGAFFDPLKKYPYVHRGGNGLVAIDAAFEMGAEIYDIDANDIHGTVRAEHGIVPQLELRLGRRGIHLALPAVFDVNEREARLGLPGLYEESVAHIASLATAERPLAVSTELKRGRFDVSTVRAMIDIHRAYSVPVIMHSPNPEKLAIVGSELAAAYNVPS